MVGGQGPAAADRRPQEWAPRMWRLYAARVWLGSAPKPVSSSLGPWPFRLVSTCWWGFKTWRPELDGLSRSTSGYHLVPSQIDQPAGPRWEGVQGCVWETCVMHGSHLSFLVHPLILHMEKLRPKGKNVLIQFPVLSPPGLASPQTSWYPLWHKMKTVNCVTRKSYWICLDPHRIPFFSFACVYLILNVFCTW